jgi:DNA-binding transcriptional MerR regulator
MKIQPRQRAQPAIKYGGGAEHRSYWLRAVLDGGRWRGNFAHWRGFSVSEVADALGLSRKVIREAARRGMIRPRPNNKGRKLFFTSAEIRRFVKCLSKCLRYGDSRALRSEKIALNPHLIRGDAVTIGHVMDELRISRSGVQYYLKRGDLKKIPCGHRTVLITRKSLERLYQRRLAKAERQFEAAEKRLEKIRGW